MSTSTFTPPDQLRIKIFADGADRAGMLALYQNPLIQGFTTNPTLMKAAGIRDYEAFARDILGAITDLPISLEVFSDDLEEMALQAKKISSWGPNVYVKIPITNTRGESTRSLVEKLAQSGLKLNITAITTLDQVRLMVDALALAPSAFVSIFAGRIADTGRDPLTVVKPAVRLLSNVKNVEIIWASPRELLNLFQANQAGCHVITITKLLLDKLPIIGKDLDQVSLDTVRMFHNDACTAGFKL